MNRWIGVAVILSGAGVIATSACSRSREPAMQPAARMSPAYSAKSAVEYIAAARCDREQRCNNVGPTAKYQNRDHCLSVARADAARELGNDEDCRRGIKPEDLNECLSQLRGRSCGTIGGALESLGSMVSCRSGELCMD